MMSSLLAGLAGRLKSGGFSYSSDVSDFPANTALCLYSAVGKLPNALVFVHGLTLQSTNEEKRKRRRYSNLHQKDRAC